ncbi:MAG TPA: SsrA-binding protein SmpB [Candidatus Omnitrophica bacterium]|nr:SsrA-binding protein SmpB [Candidatus Omnitrophota bacterium]
MQNRVIRNKKAQYLYHILETHEAGIVLKGAEVKSLREGKVSIVDSFAKVENGEIFLYHMHIAPYEEGNIFNPPPSRKRKLLLRKSEGKRLIGKLSLKGLTLVPLKVYFNNKGWAKVELGLARRKKVFDKREEQKKREIEREVDRERKASSQRKR